MSSDPTHTIYVDAPSSTTQQNVQTNSQEPSQENQLLIPNQPPQGPIFYPIIDVITEWQRGNFLPAIHCLRYNLIPKDFIDYTGYNVLHHAVSQASIPITLLLLDYFKIDVNIRSKTDQTALMIACNYGFIEIIRILCERGALINETDNTKFSALLYTVKQGRVPAAAYLLHQKADIHIRDANGCTVAHWAAYKNNVFFLKMFKSLGVDLNSLDSQGLTPLERATQSEAFDAVEFLLENATDKMPPNMKFDQISSNDIKEIIRKKFFPTKLEATWGKCVEIYLKHSQMATFAIYALLWVSMMSVYLHVAMNKTFGYTFDLLFLLFSLYSIFYIFWYFLKSNTQLKKVKTFAYETLHISSGPSDQALNDSFIRLQTGPKLNFEALNKLLTKENTGSIIHEGEAEGFRTFLHELAWLFETKNYKELARFDEKEYCPECLIKKPSRSAHCKKTGACIPYYHHYSYCLGHSIDRTNHFLYLILLIQQMLLLTLFLFGIWAVFSDRIETKIIWFIESGYLMSLDFGVTYTAVYATLFGLSIYNLVFLWIELYGVAKNVTYYEMLNRNNCPYMFKIKQDKKGAFVRYYENPYDLGFKENIKQYVGRILH